MKSGWQTRRLGEVIRLEYGKPLPKEFRKENGKHPIYGANGQKGRTDKFIFNKPSIIIGRKGSAGEVNLTEDKFWALDVTYYVDYDETVLNLKYIYNLLKTLQLQKLAKGVKPGINRNRVYSLKVLIPPLTEQNRIVSKLDNLSKCTARLQGIYQQKLSSLDELNQSLVHFALNGQL